MTKHSLRAAKGYVLSRRGLTDNRLHAVTEETRAH
jgi:hypothetical protein